MERVRRKKESELGERERGWGVSAGRVKWGECSEWGARERESWVSAVREWSEKSESEWGERMGKCKWGESRVGRV